MGSLSLTLPLDSWLPLERSKFASLCDDKLQEFAAACETNVAWLEEYEATILGAQETLDIVQILKTPSRRKYQQWSMKALDRDNSPFQVSTPKENAGLTLDLFEDDKGSNFISDFQKKLYAVAVEPDDVSSAGTFTTAQPDLSKDNDEELNLEKGEGNRQEDNAKPRKHVEFDAKEIQAHEEKQATKPKSLIPASRTLSTSFSRLNIDSQKSSTTQRTFAKTTVPTVHGYAKRVLPSPEGRDIKHIDLLNLETTGGIPSKRRSSEDESLPKRLRSLEFAHSDKSLEYSTYGIEQQHEKEDKSEIEDVESSEKRLHELFASDSEKLKQALSSLRGVTVDRGPDSPPFLPDMSPFKMQSSPNTSVSKGKSISSRVTTPPLYRSRSTTEVDISFNDSPHTLDAFDISAPPVTSDFPSPLSSKQYNLKESRSAPTQQTSLFTPKPLLSQVHKNKNTIDHINSSRLENRISLDTRGSTNSSRDSGIPIRKPRHELKTMQRANLAQQREQQDRQQRAARMRELEEQRKQNMQRRQQLEQRRRLEDYKSKTVLDRRRVGQETIVSISRKPPPVNLGFAAQQAKIKKKPQSNLDNILADQTNTEKASRKEKSDPILIDERATKFRYFKEGSPRSNALIRQSTRTTTVYQTPERPPRTSDLSLNSSPYDLPDIESDQEEYVYDNDGRRHRVRKQKVMILPRWATSPLVRDAVESQKDVDPEELFGEVRPLRVHEIFGK
ncbi:hypothetical protein BZG36_02586 [Bifiguratus adelaidae]|uniref:Inner centromere protein ARK-binding domain-containing protein n=1 Tax=Bifiguratus adelaidae TaxID=1938954 RepID=A0A261Y0Z4_9FUNG|nr:hypothetical protein BZG36_02586 [Bifiguratus adelaidae]